MVVATPVAMAAVTVAVMLAVVAVVAMAVAGTSLVTAAETRVVTVAVDAAHARTRVTHKAAANLPSHACSKRRLRASAHSHLTKMPNRQAMSPQASRLPASRQAATAVTTAAVAVVVVAALAAAVADVREVAVVAVKAVPATSARSTVVDRLMPYER